MKRMPALLIAALCVAACEPDPRKLPFPRFGEHHAALSQNQSWTFSTIGTAAAPGELRSCTTAAPEQMAVAYGFFSAGDGGGGMFVWDAGCSDVDNVGTVVRPNGMSLGCWRRQISGAWNPKWFGARADGCPTCSNPTDNAPLFAAAINALPQPAGAGLGATLEVDPGDYFFYSALAPSRPVHLHGLGGGPKNAGTRLWFLGGKSGFVFDTVATGSVVEELALYGRTGTVDAFGGHGVVIKSNIAVDRVWAQGFAGDCFWVRGATVDTPPTHASDLQLTNVYAHQCGLDGVEMMGEDSSQASLYFFEATANGRWGVNDHSFLGNHIFNGHLDSNGTNAALCGGAITTEDVSANGCVPCNGASAVRQPNLFALYTEAGQRECLSNLTQVFGGIHGSPIFGGGNIIGSSSQMTYMPNSNSVSTTRWYGLTDSHGTSIGPSQYQIFKSKNTGLQAEFTSLGALWHGALSPYLSNGSPNADAYAGSGITPQLGTLYLNNGASGTAQPSVLMLGSAGWWSAYWKALFGQGVTGRAGQAVELYTPWNASGTARLTQHCQAGWCAPGQFTDSERDAIPARWPGARIWNTTCAAACVAGQPCPCSQEWDGAAWRVVQYQ